MYTRSCAVDPDGRLRLVQWSAVRIGVTYPYSRPDLFTSSTCWARPHPVSQGDVGSTTLEGQYLRSSVTETDVGT